MKLREFFERLPKDGWEFTQHGIRDDQGRCPVCAACGVWFVAYIPAAKESGLPIRLAERIAYAADGQLRTPSDARIRRLLLKHCGLTEVQQ